MKLRRGFTLIELSIVLVIIGLIVGGVLVGRDMIAAAKVRQQLSQIEGFTTAANTFRLKYNCIPGDCANAVVLGLGASAGPGANGNGAGAITSQNSSVWGVSPATWLESFNFWYHLKMAGLISDEVSGDTAGMNSSNINGATPLGKIENMGIMVSNFGRTGTDYRTATNSFFVFDRQLTASHQFRRSGFYVPASKQIDTTIDDGLPYTGNVGCLDINNSYAIVSGPSWVCGYSVWYAAGLCNVGVQNVYGPYSGADCQTVFLNKF